MSRLPELYLSKGIDYHNRRAARARAANSVWSHSAHIFSPARWRRISVSVPAQRAEVLTQQTIEELLSQVGLKGYADRNVANLSGGEAQRVSVARTLANEPLVFYWTNPPLLWTKPLNSKLNPRFRELSANMD